MQILADRTHNEELLNKGYTIFEKLDDEIVDELKAFYESLSSPFQKGFHPSMAWNDAELKEKISKLIVERLQNWVNSNFTNYKILYGNFMVKEPGGESYMKIHQDWSYVDEKRHKSYAIWFPLQDLNDENGALSMIPKSHLFENHDRGPGVHCPFYENEKFLIDNYGVNLNLQKGQPVVWEHHLLHYSPPNMSKESRLAVTAIIVPKEIPVYHYFKNEIENQILQYAVEPSFYFHYEIGKAPAKHAQLIHQEEASNEYVSVEELGSVLGKRKDESNNKWLNKLKKFYNETITK